jgi:hypothetical protein
LNDTTLSSPRILSPIWALLRSLTIPPRPALGLGFQAKTGLAVFGHFWGSLATCVRRVSAKMGDRIHLVAIFLAGVCIMVLAWRQM